MNKHQFPRKSQLLALLPIVALIFGVSTLATAIVTDYPKKHIAWIVPYSPGGGYDTYSRAIVKILPKYLPREVNVVIKNVSGAGGRRGSSVLYRSKPDGYTIGMLNPIGLMANDLVKKNEQYDLKKYTYLATCGRGVAGLYVKEDSEFDTIEDMQKAERVKFATSGRGSGTWLYGMLFKGIWGIQVHMVSGYLGSSEYITALIRKDVDAMAIGFASALVPYCQSGEIKPIFIFSREPFELMPGTATLKGTPYEELEDFNNDRVIAGPPGLPDEISKLLENSLLKALDDPVLQAWAKKTKNPLHIADAKRTVLNINKSMALLKKYANFFKE